MSLIERLTRVWDDASEPFLIHGDAELCLAALLNEAPVDLSGLRRGDVVALIGDIDPRSIATLLRLVDLGAIILPLTIQTAHEHAYFFEAARVDAVIADGSVRRRPAPAEPPHAAIERLRRDDHAGLVLFSTGTTGRPKAILHDLTLFLRRFETPRPALRTLNFLLFDHIGGINTLLHALFNGGVVVAPTSRSVAAVLDTCGRHRVEVLPTTPTFLRMMLMSGAVPDKVPACLRLITYGTERMDQPTLDALCRALPAVDFRQTFGMSELGIVRVKSARRDSLFMRIGGEGVETRVVGGVLHIRSATRMLGYLNAESPFDAEGWYDTRDVVEEGEGGLRVVGRVSEAINVGGLKFMASEVERAALEHPCVALVKATARDNPLTGQHVELRAEAVAGGGLDKAALLAFLKTRLAPHMVPRRIVLDTVGVGHRFKRV